MSEQLTDFEAGKVVQSIEDINKTLLKIDKRFENLEKEVYPRINILEVFRGRLIGSIIAIAPLLGGLYMFKRLVD